MASETLGKVMWSSERALVLLGTTRVLITIILETRQGLARPLATFSNPLPMGFPDYHQTESLCA